MAIEIIPKKEEGPLFPQKFFGAMVALAVLLFISSLLFIFLKWRTGRAIEITETMMRESKTSEALMLESRIGSFFRKTKDFESIINARRISDDQWKSSLALLEAMESIAHPQVYFRNFQANFGDLRMRAVGVAESITAFDQQIKILRESETVSNFEVSTFSREATREIIFPISVTFNERVYQ